LLGPTADPANPKTSSISAVDFSTQSAGQFLGEFITGNPPEFTQGQKVSLTNLPEGSKLSTTEVYTISNLAIDPANPNQNLFTLLDADGVSLELSLNDIAANTQIALSAISSEGTFLSFDQRNFEGSFAGYFNNIVTVLAQELNTTNIRLEDQELSEKMAVETRDQYSGVSQDEEVTDMMKFQRSFQASARHINIIDSLLDQVVNRLGIG
jgi:flagellar hook-associated protein 1 FlgK